MKRLTSIQKTAQLENLPQFIDTITIQTRDLGFSSKRTGEICLAVEESLVNIFNYAYNKDNLGLVTMILFLGDDDMLIIEISDSGTPFNMLSLEDPDITAEIEKRKIGGLGVFLVRKLMDNVTYQFENGKNILTLYAKK
ncbi:MAG: ATP-binding protein [Desulfobacterales bacterium]|nr:ATP-binding protein [Desulfobacterales bacterium]